jgi:hypothetical protein
MNMSNPTKLVLFSTDECFNQDFLTNRVVSSIAKAQNLLHDACGWNYNIPQPVVSVQRTTKKIQVWKGPLLGFSGKKEVEVFDRYTVLLVFNKELLDDEIKVWRMIKLGLFTQRFLGIS